MDLAFDIIIPFDAKTPGLEFKVPVYEWDGVAYPQGPEEVYFHGFKVVKRDVDPHCNTLWALPNHMRKIRRWQCLSIKKGIYELHNEIWSLQNIEEGEVRKQELSDRFLELLNILLGDQRIWCLSFEREYDDGFEEIKEGDVNVVYEKMVNSLSGRSRGFIVWHNEEQIPQRFLAEAPFWASVRWIFTGKIKS
ncbi:hypothetical protein AAHN97_11105 [Chitinophaga niabensis]|uniref:hypothetical protein n=1 Tax=Chitinophaga niabensis TaxID=536979 RepID=UPI0031BAB585